MNLKENEIADFSSRRQRLHEILIALINQQKDLELMDDGSQIFNTQNRFSENYDSSKIVERNQRILKKYQALIRSAVALDALLEAEQCEI